MQPAHFSTFQTEAPGAGMSSRPPGSSAINTGLRLSANEAHLRLLGKLLVDIRQQPFQEATWNMRPLRLPTVGVLILSQCSENGGHMRAVVEQQANEAQIG